METGGLKSGPLDAKEGGCCEEGKRMEKEGPTVPNNAQWE